MQFARTHRRRNKEVSLLLLINVVFLLLFFFMVAGTIQKMELIPMQYPEAANGKPLAEGPVVIVLGSHDELVVNDELIMPEALAPTLAPLLAENPERVITIRADARVPARKVIDMMERLKQSGGINLSLVTQSKKE